MLTTVCSDLAEYEAAISSFENGGSIPVIVPGDTIRWSRWRNVLKLYETPISPSSRARSDAAIIVAVDDAFASIARLLSLATQLPTITIRKSKLISFMKASEAQAFTLVGSAATLDAGTIRSVSRVARTAWTVVTARDLPGASFVAIKILSLLNRPPNSDWLLLDAVADRVTHVKRAKLVELGRLRPNSAKTLELAGCSIHAHGEGAHADLNRSLLCGVSTSQELDDTGDPVSGGCRHRGSDIFCKRRGRRHTRLVSFHDLETKRLILMTCNGYLANMETYPSNVSALLSCLDGTVAEIITSLRPLSFSESLPLTCTQTAVKQGMTGSFALLSETFRRQGINDAIVHVGAVATPCAFDANVLASPSSRDMRLSASTSEFRFEKDVKCLSEGMLHEVSLLVDRAARWVRSLREVSPNSRAFRRLQRATLELQEICTMAQTIFMRSQDDDTSSISLAALPELLAMTVASWDRNLAELLALSSDVDAAETLHGGIAGVRRLTSLSCERCSAPIESATLRQPFMSRGDARSTLCPNCGQRDFLWMDEGSIEMRMSGSVRGESSIALEIKRLRSDWPMEKPNNAWVVIHLRDKAAGRSYFHKLIKHKGARVRTVMRLPRNLSSDLHTVKVFWIEQLTVMMARRRFAFFP